MPPPTARDILECLPQAMVRLDAELIATWVEPTFKAKTGLSLAKGEPLLKLIEDGPERVQLEQALKDKRRHVGTVVTCALTQISIDVRPAGDGGWWTVIDAAGMDNDSNFSKALQEVVRATGETLQAEAICAAAVVALVRCAQVSRAEIYLVENEVQLRRVANSDAALTPQEGLIDFSEINLKRALATREPQIGLTTHQEGPASLFAVVPLVANRKSVGLLILHKEQGASFLVRETDLWSAAASQLAVALENARLFQEAQRALKKRDEFLSIASHELKTPLTPLKMSLYLMERRLAQGLPIERASVEKSQRQLDRLTELISELLDSSRADLGKLSIEHAPMALNPMVERLVDEFRGTYERTYDLKMPTALVWIQGDAHRLEQVIINLLENAQKYSPPQEPIHLKLELDEKTAKLQIVDRGIGIPTQDQSQIFERFYRARNVSNRHFGGLGLGLFISQSIIKSHGGELLLESIEGCGSTFTVCLPLSLPVKEATSPSIKRILDA